LDRGIAVEVSQCDVRSVPRDGTVYVSPANSLGFMDGGIDAVYTEMFPGVQRAVQRRIRELGHRTALGRYYLSVGSALLVPCQGPSALITAPTMFLPHDVSGTRNAYYALVAALSLFLKHARLTREPWKTLVCPAMCCGYGKMSHNEAADQMCDALLDVLVKGNVPEELSHALYPQWFLTHDRDDEQPINFDNREIRSFDVSLL
jgi:O-acetyl-ADP-ribose deacetylase (regulator of RNase III)